MRPIARRGAAIGACIAAIAAADSHAQGGPVPSAPTSPGISSLPTTTTNRGFSIVPSVSLSETLTDNVGLSTNDRRGDLITQLTPAVRMDSTGGRVKGFADYSLTGIAYAKNSSNNNVQNALNAAVSVEAIEKRAFVDVAANISQQTISAFGTQSVDPSLINHNRTEVRTVSVSPYVRGRLAGTAEYEARYTQIWARNSSTEAANNDSSSTTLRVSGGTGPRLLNWSADASHLTYDYTVGRSTYDDIVRGVLFISPDPQFRFSLIAGRESTNVLNPQRESHSTPGFGIEWHPSERTTFSGQYEKRFFGSSHSFVFEHRTPRTVWRVSDVQEVTTAFGQPVLGSLGTAYDLFFTQFASIQPDPALRASLVQAFLAANGIAPNTPVITGSLASALTRQRRQEISFGLLGIRNTVTFGASQVRGFRIDNAVAIPDDFSNGNLVTERGLSVAFGHRLTPLMALNLVASVDHTTGSITSQSTTLKSASLLLTDQISPRIHASLSAHHTSYSSPTEPYRETGLTATVALRF